ncbi:MAG TPA: LytR C-terminal domain-containing protein [Marmoricola sp.]
MSGQDLPPGWRDGAGPDGAWVGKHRAPVTPGRKLLYRVIVPLGAVAAVVVLIVVLISLNGHDSGNAPGPGVVTASHPTVVIPSTTPTTPTPEETTPSPTEKPTHVALPPKRHHANRNAMATVRVYNTTAIQGLAHHVAAEIQSRGWTVASVGNIRLAPSTSTLYYSPSAHDAARHLAREFSGIRRLQPNSVVGLTSSGLTLVLTADWHD